MSDHISGFWPVLFQSMKDLSPKTGGVDEGILFPLNEIASGL